MELQRAGNDSPLGIQIRTSRTRPGIFVHFLVPGSTAEGNGQVVAGDRILEANGCDMRHATVDDAASFMTVRHNFSSLIFFFMWPSFVFSMPIEELFLGF